MKIDPSIGTSSFISSFKFDSGFWSTSNFAVSEDYAFGVGSDNQLISVDLLSNISDSVEYKTIENNNAITFNSSNWDETQEVRVRFDSADKIPEMFDIAFENISESDELKDIRINYGDENSEIIDIYITISIIQIYIMDMN